MWIELTPDLILKRISAPEKNALNSAAKDIEQEDVLAEVCGLVAPDWRGVLARYVTLDPRPLALPDELMIHILADFRYRAWTRLPNMKTFLDERRVAEWERANKVRDTLLHTYTIEPPEGVPPSGNVPSITNPPSLFD